MGIGDMPHLYIYNADNPAEGTVAKRRSYATLVNHMQTVMIQGGLYEELEELGTFLGEYEQIKETDPGRAHALEHLIFEAIEKTNLDKEIKLFVATREGKPARRVSLRDLDEETARSQPFEDIARAAHDALSVIRNTQIQDGMHIFGQRPQGDRRVDFINSILRYDAGEAISLRKVVASLMDLNLADLLSDGAKICPLYKKSHGELLEDIDSFSKKFIHHYLSGDGLPPEQVAKNIIGDHLKRPKPAPRLGAGPGTDRGFERPQSTHPWKSNP